MEIVADTLILLIVLQTALRLSQFSGWLQLSYCFVVGAALWWSVGFAAGLTKTYDAVATSLLTPSFTAMALMVVVDETAMAEE